MPDAIGKYSPEAVIDAIERNLIDSAIAMGRDEQAVVFRGDDVSWVYTGYPALSRVLRARFTDAEAEDRVAEIAECFRRWSAPVSWIVGPSSWPPLLPDHLKEAGFQPGETWMGLATDIQSLTLPAKNKSPVRIERISEADDLRKWTLLGGEFWPGESAAAGAVSIFSPQNAGSDPSCRFYLGYLKNQPVVRGMACIKGDTAGLYWIDSVPAHHDAGLDIALATRALADARDAGVSLAVMPSRQSSSPLCQQLGFKPYCQFIIYLWPPNAAKTPLC
jgi:hypothetical protein